MPKSLIIANGSDLDADFFEEFLLMRSVETSVLMQSHDEGRISAILCPILSWLLIEEYAPIEQLDCRSACSD